MRRIECRDEWRFSVNNIQFLEFGHFSRISSDFQYILPFRCWMHSHIMWHIMPVGVSIIAMCHGMPSISTLFFIFLSTLFVSLVHLVARLLHQHRAPTPSFLQVPLCCSSVRAWMMAEKPLCQKAQKANRKWHEMQWSTLTDKFNKNENACGCAFVSRSFSLCVRAFVLVNELQVAQKDLISTFYLLHPFSFGFSFFFLSFSFVFHLGEANFKSKRYVIHS